LTLGTFSIDPTVAGAYVDDPANVTAVSVERNLQGDLSLLEKITYTRPNGSIDYITRTIEVFNSSITEVQPFGTAASAPGIVIYGNVGSVSVSLAPNYFTSTDGEGNSSSTYMDTTATIVVPEILGYGDGPTRVEFFSNSKLRHVEDVFGADTVVTTGKYGRRYTTTEGHGDGQTNVTRYENYSHTVKLWKAGRLIAQGTTDTFSTPSVLSVKGQSAIADRVDFKINGGDWTALPGVNVQNAGAEFVSLSLGAVPGDVYEYRTYDADDNLINWARGVIGVDNSYQNASTVTVTQAKIKRVAEITSDQLPGVTGTEVFDLLTETDTAILTHSPPPPAGTNVSYLDVAQYTGLTPGITTTTQPDQVLSDTTVVDGSKTTRTLITEKNIQVVTDIHYLADDPATIGVNEALFLEEVITTTRQIETLTWSSFLIHPS